MGKFPNMLDGMSEWSNTLTFKITTQTISDFQATETTESVKFKGVLYPQTSQQLISKPEGQRSWKWWTLLTAYNLKVSDILTDTNGVEYKIVKKNDFSSSGYSEYEIAQNWTA